MRAVSETIRGYLYVAVFFVATYLFLRFALPFVLPFVLAFFLAIFIDPAVNRLESRWQIPRVLGSALVIIFLTGTLFFVTFLGMVELGAELIALSASLPEVYVLLAAIIGDAEQILGEFSEALPPVFSAAVDQQLAMGYSLAQTFLASVLRSVEFTVAALPGILVMFLITAIATYFISRDKVAVREFILGLFPDEMRAGAIEIKDRLTHSTIGLLKAQALMVLLTFAVFFIGLSLMGVRYALSIALMSALLDVLPVLGPGLVFLPWAAYAFLIGDTGFGTGLLILYGVVAIVRGSAQAYVIGERIGLHPLATLLALYLGVVAFGPVGFIYGPMVAIVLKAAVAVGLLPLGPGGRGSRT